MSHGFFPTTSIAARAAVKDDAARRGKTPAALGSLRKWFRRWAYGSADEPVFARLTHVVARHGGVEARGDIGAAAGVIAQTSLARAVRALARDESTGRIAACVGRCIGRPQARRPGARGQRGIRRAGNALTKNGIPFEGGRARRGPEASCVGDFGGASGARCRPARVRAYGQSRAACSAAPIAIAHRYRASAARSRYPPEKHHPKDRGHRSHRQSLSQVLSR